MIDYSRIETINELEPIFQATTDQQLRSKTVEFRERLRLADTLDDLLLEAFAVVREASRRVIDIRHYDVQLLAGIALHEGKVAGVQPDEGRLFSAQLALYLNSLTGRGVHMALSAHSGSRTPIQSIAGPLYFLGISVAYIPSNNESYLYDPTWQPGEARISNLRPITRPEAYRADVTFSVSDQLAFDYLRDNQQKSRGIGGAGGYHFAPTTDTAIQRGQHFVIVDEIDYLLLDEALGPLYITAPGERPSHLYAECARIVRTLAPSSAESVARDEPDGDYAVEDGVYLTEQGMRKVENILRASGYPVKDTLYTAEHTELLAYLNNALRILVFYQRGREYEVDNGKVEVLDSRTGTRMPERSFDSDIHRAIEAKEGVEIRPEQRVTARITRAGYYRLYEKISGFTRISEKNAFEFKELYNLEFAPIPTHLPPLRVEHEDLIFTTVAAKIRALIADVAEHYQQGRPVLVCTVMAGEIDHLSKSLHRVRIPHQVLTDSSGPRRELILAQVGRPGMVTLTQSTLIRSADILLGGDPSGISQNILRRQGYDLSAAPADAVSAARHEAEAQAARERMQALEAGGLYVIGTGRHSFRRHDDLVCSQAGRHAEPGECQFYLSIEDDIFQHMGGQKLKFWFSALPEDMPIQQRIVSASIAQAQRRLQGNQCDLTRQQLIRASIIDQQTTLLYAWRDEVVQLSPGQLPSWVIETLTQEVRAVCARHLNGVARIEWAIDDLYKEIGLLFTIPATITLSRIARRSDPADIESLFVDGALEASNARLRDLKGQARDVILHVIDQLWTDHLNDLSVLDRQTGVDMSLSRLEEYRIKAWKLWDDLQQAIRLEVVKTLKEAQLIESAPQVPPRPAVVRPVTQAQRPVPTGDKEELKRSIYLNVGRNDPCPCGSGKKFKNCHYRQVMAERQRLAPDSASVVDTPPPDRK